VTPAVADQRSRHLAAEGFVVAHTTRVGTEREPTELPTRGQLRDAVDGALELALALRGALPPNVAIDGSAREMARDQLFRVRTLGAKGVCLWVGELGRLVDEDGALDPRDSEVLRVWRSLAEDEAVTLLLDDADRAVSILAPVALDEWHVPVLELHGARSLQWPEDERSQDDEPDPESDVDFATDEVYLDDPTRDDDEFEALPLGRMGRPPRDAEPRHVPTERPTMRDAVSTGAARLAREHTMVEGADAERPESPRGLDAEDELISAALEAIVAPAGRPRPDEALQPQSAATPRRRSPSVKAKTERTRIDPPKTATEATRVAPPKAEEVDLHQLPSPPLPRRHDRRPPVETFERIRDDRPSLRSQELQRSVEEPAEEPTPRKERAGRGLDAVTIREHATTLSASRGSRPVKQIEQLFVEHYAPLLEAVSSGQGDRDAEHALSAWRASFEKSYQESFATIRVTGKRPKMVLDAPEEAVRIGRQTGARSAQLVLLDGLRFGLGERVQRRLEASMGDLGSCVERAILWSALPSVTTVQMQLLSQGARGLREIEAPSERDLTAFRDGTACIPRRERIGQRDLLKLDVVEARMRDVGGDYAGRMDELADEIAEAVVKVAEGLAPRTLLYVFGDHGFHLRVPSRGRTGSAEQGGARPEEVLVPGYAWLIGGPA